MSRKYSKSKIELRCLDAQFSSGDCKEMSQNPKQQYKEENNNEVDELSKEFGEMGCIVDAVKRPSNICVEDCVYEEPESENGAKDDNEDDAYSDVFEEDDEEYKDKEYDEASEDTFDINHLKAVHSEENGVKNTQFSLKLFKSQSSESCKNTASRSGSSFSKYGSVPVPQTHRINMSFTNDRLREIERHNHILLDKILSARNVRKSSIPPRPAAQAPRPGPNVASASIIRKKQQREIDRENMILLRKIQQAKSSSSSLRVRR